MAENQFTLAEAFRVVLRAGYPQRPALADEIPSDAWFFYPPKINGELTEEAKAAFSARETIMNAIRKQRVRLRGCLKGKLPDDIDPIYATQGRLKIFDGTLKVSDGGITLHTYSNVHCYQEEIESLIGDAPTTTDQPRRVTEKSAMEYVAAYIKSTVNPTVTGIRARAANDKIVGCRKIYEKEFHKQMRERDRPVRVGRPTISETPAN
jgi:hypothetical protein